MCITPAEQYNELHTEIDEAVSKVLKSGSYILGENVETFEEEFAKYLGVKYCVGVNSGTDALILALEATDLLSQKIAVPTLTASATGMAVLLSRNLLHLLDVDSRTYLMRPDETLPTDVRGVIPVHLYGTPAPTNFGDRVVIEDCCQAHGASVEGRKVGTFGKAAAFSFYPTKNLGALGDGGAVVTDDWGVYDKLLALRQYGWWVRYDSRGWGRNSRLDELQAAILRVKLPHLDEWNHARRSIALFYQYYFSDLPIQLPLVPEGAVVHQYVIQVEYRDKLEHYLRDNGIAANVHYRIPLHLQDAFQDGRVLPNAEAICSKILSLPLSDSESVIKAVRDFYADHS